MCYIFSDDHHGFIPEMKKQAEDRDCDFVGIYFSKESVLGCTRYAQTSCIAGFQASPILQQEKLLGGYHPSGSCYCQRVPT